MNTIIRWWADNHVAANLLMVTILLTGLLGYCKSEREIFPTLDFPGMQVTVSWPGASPLDVEQQIVSRIEESLNDLEGLDWVRSESREGVGVVFIRAESAVDFSSILDEVTSRVRSISSLPPDIEQPQITQWDTGEEMLRVAVHGSVGERRLKRLADEMRREVAQLKGVTIVETFGTREEEISIEISEAALTRYRISFDEIARAIRGTSLNMSAGNVLTDAGQYTLRAKNLADSDVDFANIVVRQTADGGIVRLSDLANIVDGFEQDEILATLNGEPAALIQVMSSEVMDVVVMSESVNAWVEERRKTLPPGVSLTLWQDAAVDFNSRMQTIGSAAFSGLILVFLVLFLTLRPKVAFWVAMGVATAYAGTFIFLPALGVSLNMLSTFAFLLVLGIVVDDAIIIGERVHTEVEEGNLGVKGASDGAIRVSKPVIFGVLTTIIAFMPWLFVSGLTSEFTRQITWVVILALTFSLIESLFILPSHLSNLKPVQPTNRLAKFQNRISESIVWFGEVKFGAILRSTLARPVITSVVFLAFFLIMTFGLLGAGHIRSAFSPEIESQQVRVNIELREGTTYERALEILGNIQVSQQALVDEVEKRAAKEGSSNQVIENWYTRSRRDSVIAIMHLAPPEVRAMNAKEVALDLRERIGDIPEAKNVSVGYSIDNDGPDMDISVRHPNLEQLQLAVDEISDKLRSFPALYDVSHNLESAGEEVRFNLRPSAEQLGVSLSEIMTQVRQAYFGEEVQRLPREGQDVKVMLRYPPESRDSLESLKHFRVRVADGRQLPLTSLVDISYAEGLKEIRHWGGLRAARVQAYLKEPIREQIMRQLNKDFFPDLEARYPGLTRAAVGEQVGEQEFLQEIAVLGGLAFVAVLFLLAIAFKSYFQPVVILIALPFAFAGALLGHLIMNVSFSIWSYFGAIAAFGVVINDNLVLVDAYKRYLQQGHSVMDAIVKAGKTRFRPILITSVTTFIGLVPLMLEQSSQSAFLKPTVISLAFALVVAFFVTLFLVPCLLVIGDKITRFFSRIGKSIKLQVNYTKAKYESN